MEAAMIEVTVADGTRTEHDRYVYSRGGVLIAPSESAATFTFATAGVFPVKSLLNGSVLARPTMSAAERRTEQRRGANKDRTIPFVATKRLDERVEVRESKPATIERAWDRYDPLWQALARILREAEDADLSSRMAGAPGGGGS
jgi:hypothetical protein